MRTAWYRDGPRASAQTRSEAAVARRSSAARVSGGPMTVPLEVIDRAIDSCLLVQQLRGRMHQHMPSRQQHMDADRLVS